MLHKTSQTSKEPDTLLSQLQYEIHEICYFGVVY